MSDAPYRSPFVDLPAFSLELLLAIPRAEATTRADYDGPLPSGSTVRDVVADARDETITKARLYDHLARLEGAGLVEREQIAPSTKGVRLTDDGVARLAMLADAARASAAAAGGEDGG